MLWTFNHHVRILAGALGVTESGNFPAANKTMAEWFPKKERALATGLYNSGANIGAIVAPLTVPWIAYHWGWEWAFILTGAVGLIWLLFWMTIYYSPDAKLKSGKLTQKEYDFIHSDVDEKPVNDDSSKARVTWWKLLNFSSNLGLLFRKIPFRSGLVVFLVLVARFPEWRKCAKNNSLYGSKSRFFRKSERHSRCNFMAICSGCCFYHVHFWFHLGEDIFQKLLSTKNVNL
jgi:MFS family permease